MLTAFAQIVGSRNAMLVSMVLMFIFYWRTSEFWQRRALAPIARNPLFAAFI